MLSSESQSVQGCPWVSPAAILQSGHSVSSAIYHIYYCINFATRWQSNQEGFLPQYVLKFNTIRHSKIHNPSFILTMIWNIISILKYEYQESDSTIEIRIIRFIVLGWLRAQMNEAKWKFGSKLWFSSNTYPVMNAIDLKRAGIILPHK